MKKNKTGNRANLGKIAFRGGSYSLIITAVVLALLIVVNIFANRLPATLTKLDISASKLYSITSNTKAVVGNLQKDVTIYWIVQADAEDSILSNLLSKYESLSGHIQVVKKNPDVFPTFTANYTEETVENNSLIVECGDRYRYIPLEEIYESEVDQYTYSYVVDAFDGEGVITSAIDYVVSEELLQMYIMEGHGEAELPATFSDQITKDNIEMTSFTLLNTETVPEEADCVLIYAPQSDISAEEKETLASYVENGGKLLVMAGPVEGGMLTNLNSLLEDYSITVNEGIVVEGDSYFYAFQQPYILLPGMQSSAITDSLLNENYYVILPLAQGLTGATDATDATVTELLSTSTAAFSKIAGFELETYEMEEGDIEGSFALGVAIDTAAGGSMVWFTCSEFVNETYNSWSSGANVDLAMNAVSYLVGETEAMAIRSKSMDYNYLTISESTASQLKVLMIGVVPLLYLGIGIGVLVRTRRKQNEAVS